MYEPARIAALSLFMAVGCSTYHVATFNDPAPNRNLAKAEIERCLADLGMNEVSGEWPYSEYIEEFPEDVVAIWTTPPIEYSSWWHQLLESPSPEGYGTAWIRPHEQTFRVSFHKHDHSLPDEFGNCVSTSPSGISVEIESDTALDLS